MQHESFVKTPTRKGTFLGDLSSVADGERVGITLALDHTFTHHINKLCILTYRQLSTSLGANHRNRPPGPPHAQKALTPSHLHRLDKRPHRPTREQSGGTGSQLSITPRDRLPLGEGGHPRRHLRSFQSLKAGGPVPARLRRRAQIGTGTLSPPTPGSAPRGAPRNPGSSTLTSQ